MANDKGQEYTDSVISELEKKIQKEYKQANDEVQQKVDDYFARFAKKDQKKQAQLKAGYITQEEYNDWRYGQVCVGERWKELKQNIAQDYVNTNQIARAMIEDRQADVYAMNHNFATYQVEHDSLMDTSYTLYNRRTVQNLIKDDPRLLPFPKTDSPTAKKLSERMDLIWNRQKINSAITQGVLQGESIPQISKRLEKVTDMNHSAAVRNARTMMTSCENKGRQDAYDSLRDKGIDLAEKWVATLDGRTRHSHRHLHGTYKNPKTGLYENGLEYPGDPFGEPEEIYNCRCCEIAEVLGFKIDTPTTSPKLGGMSFDEWLNAKGNKESLWWYKENIIQSSVVNGKNLMSSWVRREQFEFAIDDIINAQGFDGLPTVVSPSEFETAVEENGIICKRGYTAPNAEALEKYREELYYGKWYVDCSKGGAAFGQGMYSFGEYGTKLTEQSEIGVKGYGNHVNGRIETFTLKNPRIINYDAIKDERSKIFYNIYMGAIDSELNDKQDTLMKLMTGYPMPDEIRNDFSLLSDTENVKYVSQLLASTAKKEDVKERVDNIMRMNDGVFSALLGYDAIEVDVGRNEKYFVVLNRTKCIFKGD